MRHGKKFNHLGRQHAHRELMLSNMSVSLIMSKRIYTTVAKAKALRKYLEPILTRAKSDSMHARRVAFADLRNKHAVKELFATVSPKIMDRPGGYTRIVRTGHRLGDNAEMCLIELVDFNLDYSQAKTKTAKKEAAAPRTRRSRAKKAVATEATQPEAQEVQKDS